MLKPSAPQGVKRYSLVVVVRATTCCPMACQYCGYSRHVTRDRRSLPLDTLVHFGQVLQEYRSLTNRDILVCWLGGEPFLWPELWSVTQLYREAFDLPIGVTTAGVNLHAPDIQQNVLRWIDELTVSVDGLAEHHEWARQAPGTWLRLRESVCQLAQMRVDSSPLLRANMVLMQSNIDCFASICGQLAQWGFDELSFNQLGPLDRPEFFPANRILPEQWKQFRDQLPAVRTAMSDRGLTITGSEEYLDRIEATTLGLAIPVDDCQPGQEFWFVDEFGRLSPCSYTSGVYHVTIDTRTTLEDLVRVPDRLRNLRQDSSCQACADCHATHRFAKFRQNV